MKTFKIFTSGKMGGLNYGEQMAWRNQLENQLKDFSCSNVQFVHPPMFYQYSDNIQDEIEAKEWEINQLKDSDIVVFNLSNISESIGTHIELGIIDAINSSGLKHIYTVGIGKSDTNHPWIKQIIMHVEETVDAAAEYIRTYLLI